MKCKDIRHWLMDGKGESRVLPAQIQNHLSSCSSCARFWENLSFVQKQMDLLPAAALPPELREETHQLCRSVLEGLEDAAPASGFNRAGLPKIIWAAVFLLLGLTAGIVTTLFTDLNLSEGLTPKSTLIVTIMIQNAVMLFFAPVLLRRHQRSKPV